MPREKIRSSHSGGYDAKIGWGAGGTVQLGVETENDETLYWNLFAGDESRRRLGSAMREALFTCGAIRSNEPGSLGMSDQAVGEMVLRSLDDVGSYRGVWSTLDRDACNQLIRLLRKARDFTFGKDE